MVAFRIRLHLFASDRDRALQILNSELQPADEEERMVCPRCRSTRLTRDFPKKDADRLPYVLFGIFLPHRKVNICLDCGLEF